MIEIFIDIETVPTTRAEVIAQCIADVGPPANYKKAETIEQWWETEGEAKKARAVEATALDGTWGELLMVGIAVDDAPVEVLRRTTTEADLLRQFALTLNDRCMKADRGSPMWPAIAKWIGHHIMDFDLRFLWQRSRLCGVPFPFSLPLRQHSPSVFDTMKEWAGPRGYIKQTDLELAFNIERDDPLPNGGADVFAAFKEGRIDDIAEHVRLDVEDVRKIYRRMTA